MSKSPVNPCKVITGKDTRISYGFLVVVEFVSELSQDGDVFTVGFQGFSV